MLLESTGLGQYCSWNDAALAFVHAVVGVFQAPPDLVRGQVLEPREHRGVVVMLFHFGVGVLFLLPTNELTDDVVLFGLIGCFRVLCHRSGRAFPFHLGDCLDRETLSSPGWLCLVFITIAPVGWHNRHCLNPGKGGCACL